MATAKVNADTFYKRVDSLMKIWRKDEGPSGLFKGNEFLAFVFGRSNESLPYSKTSAVFRWLIGYDLTDTLVLLDKRGVGKVTFFTSQSKIKVLQGLLPAPEVELDGRKVVEVELLEKIKGSEKAGFDRIVSRLKAGPVGGVWNEGERETEPQEGAFAEMFLQAAAEENVSLQDVSEGVSQVFLVKDSRDVNFVKSACSIADVVFRRFVVPKLEEEANEANKIFPNKISDTINGYFLDPERISQKLQSQFVDSCYAPLFSSGSQLKTDLTQFKPSSKPLDYSVIVCGVGAKYKSLCSNVLRTVLINPSTEMTATYDALVAAHKAAIEAIKPGAPLSSVFVAAKRALAELNPQLAEHLDPVVGHSMGYEFCETIKLSESSVGTFEPGQVFNVMLLLQKVNEGKSAMGLADTLVVTGDGADVLTKAKKTDLQYDLDDKADESDGDNDVLAEEAEGLGKRKSRMRDQSAATTEMELQKKQKENFERLQAELARRAEQGDEIAGPEESESQSKDWLQLNSYQRGANSFPNDAAPFRLVVDPENETILLPLNGYVVPIHITLVKSVTKLDDTIRFTFHVPGKGKLSASANAIVDQLPNTVFIKEVVYSLQNSTLLSSIERSIKEMKKRVLAQEKRRSELAGITEQDHLILARERTPQLPGLFSRPSVSGKRVMGTLDAHTNGFRYTTVKGQKLDVIYNNIAHAFFQPAEQEALVILHFNLRNPIMIGKKKCEDVQFVQETMEASSRLDSRRRTYGDADEIEEEQREKLARKKINRTFFKFCKDVEQFSKRYNDGDEVIKFDYPSRELGFMGVPFKSNVLLQPTAQDCLVHLVEGPPFFVLSLDNVEVASFERVMFGLRQFDLIFVLKDYSKQPVTINSIPVEALETLQEWLSKSNVLFYLNPQPYNWTMIMQEVRNKTLKEFLDEGGWSFLGDAPEEEQEADQESEGNSEDFEPEGSESSESDFDEEDEEEEGSEGDDEEEEEGSEDEEAADWEELEQEAARKDRKKWGGTGEPPAKKKK